MVDVSRWTELLDVVSCDITSRPSAPGPGELQTYLVGASRFAGALVYEFRPEARDALTQFVAAERVCCSGLSWDIVENGQPTLRIGASESQLDVLEGMFALA